MGNDRGVKRRIEICAFSELPGDFGGDIPTSHRITSAGEKQSRISYQDWQQNPKSAVWWRWDLLDKNRSTRGGFG
jgi:hypothetical protein